MGNQENWEDVIVLLIAHYEDNDYHPIIDQLTQHEALYQIPL